jgi:hypothetical protein
MKICPRCQKTYTDDNLNFCLDDGTVLTQAGGAMPETVLINQPRPTDPHTGFGTPPPTQAAWNTTPQHAAQPKKSSKAWIWVVGILAVLVLICGGGFVAFFAYIASISNSNTNSSGRNGNLRPTPAPSSSATPKSTPDNTSADAIDLSAWVKEFSLYGTTEFTGGELIMSSKQKGYYYVVAAPDDYTTEGATTKVTVRNIDDMNSSMGYGLVFHSNPSPLTQGYAFLIDAKKKKYRVVRHEPQKEISVVPWTNSALIKDGTQENLLEIRDKGDMTELYINDQMVTSIKNTYAYKNGVPGLYAGDAVRTAFKDLKIIK